MLGIVDILLTQLLFYGYIYHYHTLKFANCAPAKLAQNPNDISLDIFYIVLLLVRLVLVNGIGRPWEGRQFCEDKNIVSVLVPYHICL